MHPRTSRSRPRSSRTAKAPDRLRPFGPDDYEENFFLRNLLKQQSAERAARARLRDWVEDSAFTSRRQKQHLHYSGLDFGRSRSCVDLNKVKKAMTMYISSFYKNIQKEFHHTRDDKKSKLVKTYEYFDKAKRNEQQQQQQQQRRVPISHREPEIRRLQRGVNQMSVSLDTAKRSDLLNRRQKEKSRPVRNVSAENRNHLNSRRSSEVTRNRSLVRQAVHNDRLLHSAKQKHRRDKKSVKSTEGSSKKSKKGLDEAAIDETEDYGMDETDELYKRIMDWVETVNKHIEADDFDKCVIMDNIDYPAEVDGGPDPYHQSPGNHHHVEIVLYNGD